MFRVNDVVESKKFGGRQTVASVDSKEKTIHYVGGGRDSWRTQRLIERPLAVGDLTDRGRITSISGNEATVSDHIIPLSRLTRAFSIGETVVVLGTDTVASVQAKNGELGFIVGGMTYNASSLAPVVSPPVAEKRFLLLNDNSIIGRHETFEQAESAAKINNATQIIEVARRWNLVTVTTQQFQEIFDK